MAGGIRSFDILGKTLDEAEERRNQGQSKPPPEPTKWEKYKTGVRERFERVMPTDKGKK